MKKWLRSVSLVLAVAMTFCFAGIAAPAAEASEIGFFETGTCTGNLTYTLPEGYGYYAFDAGFTELYLFEGHNDAEGNAYVQHVKYEMPSGCTLYLMPVKRVETGETAEDGSPICLWKRQMFKSGTLTLYYTEESTVPENANVIYYSPQASWVDLELNATLKDPTETNDWDDVSLLFSLFCVPKTVIPETSVYCASLKGGAESTGTGANQIYSGNTYTFVFHSPNGLAPEITCEGDCTLTFIGQEGKDYTYTGVFRGESGQLFSVMAETAVDRKGCMANLRIK